MEETEDKEKRKLQSRKFIVWLVWLIITIAILVVSTISMLVTKSMPDTFIDLIKLVLEYFFYVSIAYVSVNGIQKIGFAVADAFAEKKEECSNLS